MNKKSPTRRFLTRSGPVDGAFRRLSPAQKRIAVATDALRWLKSKVVLARPGNYVAPTRAVKGDSELSAVSPKGVDMVCEARCEVCAKGALFLATVMRTNKINIYNTLFSGDDYTVSSKVCYDEHVFSGTAFEDIEAVFENHLEHQPVIQDAWRRYPKHTAPTMRLKAILVNILMHKGTFRRSYVPTPAEIKQWLAKV